MKPYTKDEVMALKRGAEVYLQSRYPYVVPRFPVQIRAVSKDRVSVNINDTTSGTLYLPLYGTNMEEIRGWLLWPDAPTPEDRKAVQWETITREEISPWQLRHIEVLKKTTKPQWW